MRNSGISSFTAITSSCEHAQTLKIGHPAIGQMARRSIFLLAIVSAIAISSPTFADSISGTYVGSSPDGAFLVQVVQTDDGQLTGRYEQVLLQSSGKLVTTNAALNGATNNGTVVVTIKPTEFLTGSITLSGTFDGRTLHLAGGGNGKTISLNLINANESAFHTQVTNLTNRANQIHQASIEADALVQLQKLIKLMDAFSANADQLLPKFAPTEQNLKTITGQMGSALAKQQAIQGDGQADVARNQVSIWISQAEISASQVNDRVDAAYRDFKGKSAPILKKLESEAPGCNDFVSGKLAGLDPDKLGVQKSNCLKLLDSAKTFQTHFESLRKAFAHFGTVWDEEHQKQVGIVKASDDAAR